MRSALARWPTSTSIKCTIEEREEYEPHIWRARPFTPAWTTRTSCGRRSRKRLILWDGGNNDTSFYRPDLDIVVLDPHRAGHELAYYPGEVNFRTADVLIINKVDTADPDGIKTVRQNIALHNPKARVIETACQVTVADPEASTASVCWWWKMVPRSPTAKCPTALALSRPTVITRPLVDPRPYAVGSIQKTFEKFPHLWRVLAGHGLQRHAAA